MDKKDKSKKKKKKTKNLEPAVEVAEETKPKKTKKMKKMKKMKETKGKEEKKTKKTKKTKKADKEEGQEKTETTKTKKTKKKKETKLVDLGDDEEDSDTLKVNETFAKEFRERSETSALSRKQGGEFERLKRELEEEEEDSDEYSSEDEMGDRLTSKLDIKINQTLAMIRSKDKQIYQKDFKAFDDVEDEDEDEEETKTSSKSKKSVKEVLRQQLLSGGGEDSDDDEGVWTEVKEEKRIKKAFQKQAKEEEDEGDMDDFFSVKARSPAEIAKELEEQQKLADQNKEALKSFFGAKEKTDDGNFLEQYITNEWWKQEDAEGVPQVRDEDELDMPDEDEDEDYLDAQDNFEAEYNFRFQEEGANEIMTYPRNVDDSVRQKTSKRKRQREAKKLRKDQEKTRKMEELKRLKGAKRKEILEKLKQIEEITGTSAEELGLDNLERPFDPKSHDQNMGNVYDHFEGQEDAEYPEWDDDELAFLKEGDEDFKVPTPGKFAQAELQKITNKEKQWKKKHKNADPEKSREVEEAKLELAKKVDDLYKLDYEDIIGGDIPCRFKYMKVAPVDYGMSVVDILNSSDKELNQRVGMAKLAPYRDDANENLHWTEIKKRHDEIAAHVAQGDGYDKRKRKSHSDKGGGAGNSRQKKRARARAEWQASGGGGGGGSGQGNKAHSTPNKKPSSSGGSGALTKSQKRRLRAKKAAA